MGRYAQFIAMASGATWVLITGANLGWSSPFLPVLQSDQSPVGKITSDEAFWCSVMPLIGAIPGALLAGVLADILGRRNIIIALTPLGFSCFVAIAYTSKLWILDLARFLIGSMEGATYTVLPMYFGEIAEPGVRGVMSASIIVGAVFGLLVINVLARFLTIYTISMVLAVIPLITLAVFICLPKSPYYLIKIGQLEEAKKSLVCLRSDDEVKMNEEFSMMIEAVKRQESAMSNSSWTDLFTQKSNRRGVYIYFIMMATTKFSGANPLMFYTETIFDDADGILDSKTSVLIFHFVGTLCVLFAAFLVDKFGRRPLVMVSAVGCGCSLLVMATYLTLLTFDYYIVDDLRWMPIVGMISYYGIFNLGLCLGPIVFLSELFPTSVKGYALGMADSTSVLFGTLASKVFHGMSERYGMYSAFWFFCAVCMLGTIVIYFVVPETKGKTLEEIQLELTGDQKIKSSGQN